MSDIPIGSPPVPPGRHAAPSGWYPDPVDPLQERYWDGWQWSRNTRLRDDIGKGVAAGFRPEPAGAAPVGPVAPGPDVRPATFGGGPQATRTADGVPLAGWWWRALAVYLDSMVVGALGMIAGFSIYQKLFLTLRAWSQQVAEAAREGLTEVPPLPLDMISRSDQLTLTLIQVTIALAYNVTFLHWRGATLGKMICGLKVVPVDLGRSTENLGWGTVTRRAMVWVLPTVSSLLLLLRVVDGLLPLWHPKRQALHDLAAQTQVVRLR